jgi:DNA polymerase-3 subunit epsilon
MYYLVVDLEMTGPKPGYHDIIEIGAVLLNDDWGKMSTFGSLIYPQDVDTFTSSAEAIHGISLDDLEDAPLLGEVLDDFEMWIRKSLRRDEFSNLSDVMVCGQGILHDLNFLQYAYEEENKQWPFSKKVLDLISITYFGFKILSNNGVTVPKTHGLSAVAGYFGLARSENEHDAVEDAILTAACFQKFNELFSKFKLG